MNDTDSIDSRRRGIPRMMNARPHPFLFRWGGPLLAVALGSAGCADRDAVRVQLRSSVPPTQGVMHLEVAAQVSGPQDGLRFKWFSVAGACNPQESGQPATLFKFADGATRDRVTVEVWR